MTAIPDSLTLAADDRGVSEVIGSILVFGILVLMLTLAQTQLIPAANQDVEFQHSQRVQQDFVSLHTASMNAISTGEAFSSEFKLGMTYPPRLLFLNPPPVQGTLKTTDPTASPSIQIRNIDTESSAEAYLDSTQRPRLDFTTGSVSYSVTYNRLRGSISYTMEPAAVFRTEDGARLVSDTTLVDGKEITLVAIGGNLDANTVTAQEVSVKALSAPAKEYAVRDDGSPLTVRVPTDLSEQKWKKLLADELDPPPASTNGDPDAFISSLSVTNGVLELQFETNTQYTLRMAKVGFGNGGDPAPRYVTSVDSEPGTARIQVRDEFSNPVAGATVHFEVKDTSGATVRTGTVTSDPGGFASVEHQPGSGGVKVLFEEDLGDDGTSVEDYERQLAFFDDDIVVTDVTGTATGGAFDITVQNQGPPKEIEKVQVHHLTSLQAGITVGVSTVFGAVQEDGPQGLTKIEVDGTSRTFTTTQPQENSKPAKVAPPLTLAGGTTSTITFDNGIQYPSTDINDGLQARVTLFFGDGTKKTFDVVIQGDDIT